MVPNVRFTYDELKIEGNPYICNPQERNPYITLLFSGIVSCKYSMEVYLHIVLHN